MKRRRLTWTIALLGGCGLVLAVIVLWPRILERYYHHQLEDARTEEAWDIARKLEDMKSIHAEDWYIERLNDTAWETRLRAVKSLVSVGTERAIESAIGLEHPSIDSPGGSPPTGLQFLISEDSRGVSVNFGQAWNKVSADKLVAYLNKRAHPFDPKFKVRSTRAGALRMTATFYSGTFAIQELSEAATIIGAGGERALAVVESIVKTGKNEDTRTRAELILRLIPEPLRLFPPLIITN